MECCSHDRNISKSEVRPRHKSTCTKTRQQLYKLSKRARGKGPPQAKKSHRGHVIFAFWGLFLSDTSFAWPKFVSLSRVVRDIYHPHDRAEPGSSPHTISRAAAISAVRFARREEEEGGRREGRREEHEERWPAAEAETVRRRRITGGCRQGGGTPGVHGSLQM